MTEDDVPQPQTLHLIAYSVDEAIYQALVQVTGSVALDDAKVRVVSVQPDPKRWLADKVARAAAALIAEQKRVSRKRR